ncbi:hypothetical protein NJBCHELONAE_47950 [Mycobacteroides chelonae]|nr:hypothetical protein NJBCHELONAE_47950 [Mycobacteroides chelonae]
MPDLPGRGLCRTHAAAGADLLHISIRKRTVQGADDNDVNDHDSPGAGGVRGVGDPLDRGG